MNRPRLAYLMSRFPHLPETFILREMVELGNQGFEIEIYPLILQKQTIVHPEASTLLGKTHPIPFFSLRVVSANLRALLRRPGNYLSTLKRCLVENSASPKFLLRAAMLFPKAVAMAEKMRQGGIQHIHAHYATHPALAAWIIHRFSGIPYSITVHAHDIFVERAMLATKLHDAAFIIAISQYNCDFLARTVGEWVRSKVHVIHCGIRTGQYTPRQVRGEPGGTFEVLNIGSLQPYKGQRVLVEACARLRQRGIPVHCRIIGGGELEDDLHRLVAERGLQGSVELLGPRTQEEVAALLPTADCYAQPSVITPSGKMEGIPVSIMEALACELPVVATRISGIPELVREGETGFLVEPCDPEALAEALERIYRHPEDAGRLAQAGRQLVLKEYELRTNVEKISSLFGGEVRFDAFMVNPVFFKDTAFSSS